ncbi:Putative peptidoglycan binding domain-containing protein, partial [Gracilibacillus orientalis]
MGATLSRVFFIFTFAMLISLYNSSFISAEEAQKTNELKEVVAEEQQESESAEKGSSEDKSQGTESVEEQQEESVEKEVSEGDKENASQGETSEKEKQEPVEEETEEIKKDKTSEDKIEEATITVQEDISWVIPLKENLTRLGFGGMNINDTYGSFTAQRVGEFQTYYGLKVNKEADEATLAKIDDISSSPFQEGETHDDTIELKRLLTWLGYGNMNINEIYGS